MKIQTVSYEDMVWHEKKTNNIPTNPLEYYYCIIDTGKLGGRMYAIETQTELDENLRIGTDDKPKYYLLYEVHVQKATPEEAADSFHYNVLKGYRVDDLKRPQVFDDLDTAKRAAYTKYSFIYNTVMTYIDEDKITEEVHRVVTD